MTSGLQPTRPTGRATQSDGTFLLVSLVSGFRNAPTVRTVSAARKTVALTFAAVALGGGLAAQIAEPEVAATKHRELGFRYLQEGSPQAALGQFHAAVETDPNDKHSRLAIGIIQAQHGRLAGALDQFEATIAIDPNFAEAHFQRGLALEKSGRPQ